VETTRIKQEEKYEECQLYPEATREISEKRAVLAPEIVEAFRNFSKAVLKTARFRKKQNSS